MMSERDDERFLEGVRRNAAAPVLAELAKMGLSVGAISELYNEDMDYQRAIPVLLDWLPRVPNHDVKEELVRAVSVKWAKPQAAPLLVKEFRAVAGETGAGLRWAIGNALEVVSDVTVLDDLLDIAKNREYGMARQMVVVALGKLKDPRAIDTLIGLVGDDDVTGQAVGALGALRAREALPVLEGLSEHSNSWIRKEAEKAIAKISQTQG